VKKRNASPARGPSAKAGVGEISSQARKRRARQAPTLLQRGEGQFLNGDFLEPIIQNDPGFGWQVTPTPNVVVSIDPSGPAPGALEAFGLNSAAIVMLEAFRSINLSCARRKRDSFEFHG
jgi:hypothetical protein